MPTQRPSASALPKATSRTADALDRLEAVYGRQRHIPRFDPMDELVCCVLSQHSADINSFPAFTALKEAWPTWQLLASATHAELGSVIQNAGLANQKAKNILALLPLVHQEFGGYTLEPLRHLPVEEGLAFLRSLPGVGPKTASIVMCLAFGKHAVPVDTHVHRVGIRLGLFSPETTADQAHPLLQASVPEGRAFAFHVTLLQHGRTLCSAKSPTCQACPVIDICQYERPRKAAG